MLSSSWVRGKPFRQGVWGERGKEQMSLKLLVSVTLDLGILAEPQPNACTVSILRVWKPAQGRRWCVQGPSDGDGQHRDQNPNLRGSGNLDGEVESTGRQMGSWSAHLCCPPAAVHDLCGTMDPFCGRLTLFPWTGMEEGWSQDDSSALHLLCILFLLLLCQLPLRSSSIRSRRLGTPAPVHGIEQQTSVFSRARWSTSAWGEGRVQWDRDGVCLAQGLAGT